MLPKLIFVNVIHDHGTMFSVHVFINIKFIKKIVLFYRQHIAIMTQRKLDCKDF